MANGNSWLILDSMRDNLASYIDANKGSYDSLENLDFTLECADYSEAQLFEKLNGRKIGDFFIGFYEIQPDDILDTGTGFLVNWNQAYEFKMFNPIPKKSSYDEEAERVLMNVKDLILAWINQLEPYTVTSNLLANFSYISGDSPTRADRYCFTAIQCTGTRDDL